MQDRERPEVEDWGNELDYLTLRDDPRPQFGFQSNEHLLAIAKVAYAVQLHKGLSLLMGEPGTGKTTISQLAKNSWQAEPERYSIVYIDNPPRLKELKEKRARPPA